MTKIVDDPKGNGAAGGRARSRNLSPAERSEIAQRAADARWGKTVATVSYQGEVNIANEFLECVVLQDGRRVIAQKSIMESLGRSPSSGRRTRNDNRPPFIEAGNLQKYITPELREKMGRIEYRVPGSRTTRFGYNAEILPDVCELYLLARKDDALLANQLKTAEAAEVLIRTLAKVGIIALVDEATGYQDKRAKDELQLLLEKYVAEEFRPWVKTFPEAFFKQIYRLHGWEFKPGNVHHPSYVGKFINKYVYDALPSGVTARLRELNPITTEKRSRARKHHQHIPSGQPREHLDKTILQVTTLMEVSRDKQEFEAFHGRLNTTKPHQEIMDIEL